MKTQLLEDIGENHSLPSIPPQDTVSTPASGTPLHEAAPAADKWRAGPWRHREELAAQQRAAPAFAEPPPPPPEPSINDLDPDPLAESWARANPDPEPAWFERWGRRAAVWSAGFAAVVLVAGGAAWMYKETKADEALAVASASLDAPIPGFVTRAPIGPVEPVDVKDSELALATTDFQAEIPDFAPTPAAAKPVRSRVRTVARAAARRAPPPAPAAAPSRESQMAETLRQCRAAGYHAEQCIRRSCVATPYGIACKG